MARREIDVERNGSVARTFTINSAVYGGDRCSQQKLGSTRAVAGFARLCAPLSCSLFTPRCLHPPLLADNHRAGLSFLHSFPFLPLLALARKELSQLSLCGHPKSEADSKVFCATSPWVSTELRKWGGEEEGKRVCVIHRGTQTSESESSVEAHQWRKKPDLLSPKKSTADVSSQILPLPPITDTHAKIYSTPPEPASSHTHMFTQNIFVRTVLYAMLLCMHIYIYMGACTPL